MNLLLLIAFVLSSPTAFLQAAQSQQGPDLAENKLLENLSSRLYSGTFRYQQEWSAERFGCVPIEGVPVGYVAVLRESSVIIGAYAGWVFLHEDLGSRRLVSSLVVASGLALLVIVR